MAKFGWICEGCRTGNILFPTLEKPWKCPGCGKEICDNCGWMWAHCKACCEGKTERELALAAIEAGFDFELPEDAQTQTEEDRQENAQ